MTNKEKEKGGKKTQSTIGKPVPLIHKSNHHHHHDDYDG